MPCYIICRHFFGIYRYFRPYFSIEKNLPNFANICRKISVGKNQKLSIGCSIGLRFFKKFPAFCHNLPAFFGIYRYFRPYFSIEKNLPEFANICRNFAKSRNFAKICRNLPNFAGRFQLQKIKNCQLKSVNCGIKATYCYEILWRVCCWTLRFLQYASCSFDEFLSDFLYFLSKRQMVKVKNMNDSTIPEIDSNIVLAVFSSYIYIYSYIYSRSRFENLPVFAGIFGHFLKICQNFCRYTVIHKAMTVWHSSVLKRTINWLLKLYFCGIYTKVIKKPSTWSDAPLFAHNSCIKLQK